MTDHQRLMLWYEGYVASIRTSFHQSACVLTSSLELQKRLLPGYPYGVCLISEWMKDGSGHPTPVWTTLPAMIAQYATYGDIAEALERTYSGEIPSKLDGLRSVTGKGSKEVKRGGVPPFNALAYA